MKAPKNLYNSFGKYNYRNAESILEAFKPFGEKYKVVLMVSDSAVLVGNKNYIQATATIYDCESDAFFLNTALAREADTKKGMDDSQITGATSSYARKYALNGLFLLDDTKDADSDEYANQTGKQMTKEELVDEASLRARVIKYITDCKMSMENVEKLCNHYKVEKPSQFSKENCLDYINQLKQKGIEI